MASLRLYAVLRHPLSSIENGLPHETHATARPHIISRSDPPQALSNS